MFRKMSDWDNLRKVVLIDCATDDVGLWMILVHVESIYKIHAPSKIRDLATTIIRELLNEGLIKVGLPVLVNDERKIIFEEWASSPNQTIERINKEWDKLGREPNIGDIVWFTATPKGLEYIKKHYGLKS